jgi:hypothetical protein
MEPTRLREVLQAEYVPSWAAGGVILNVLPEDEARSAWFKWAVK